MPMTRNDWDTFQANRSLVLDALRDNPNDYFSAREILSFLADSAPEMTTLKIGKILVFAHEDGLVDKQRDGSQHLWAINEDGLAWEPQPYDWRRSRRTDTPSDSPAPEALAAPSRPRNGKAAPTPSPTHPWVASPAVSAKRPKSAPITRPLPAHLESKAMDAVATAAPLRAKAKSYADITLPAPPSHPESPAMTDTATPGAQPEPVGTDTVLTRPPGLSLTDYLLAEAEHRLTEHTAQAEGCCGRCHADDADVIAEDEEAREQYIQLLLAYGDQRLERDPVWQAARNLGPHFDLAVSYL